MLSSLARGENVHTCSRRDAQKLLVLVKMLANNRL